MNPIRLRGPADILAALPYQLGYHPGNAVVVVALSNRAVGLVQRVDLPPVDHVSEAVAALLPALTREEADAVLLVGYESTAGESLPALDALADACTGLGLEVVDRLVVRGERWFAPDCDGGCCPAEGTPMTQPADVPVVAEFVALEMAPVADRDALTRQLQPDEGRCEEVDAALTRAAADARRSAAAEGRRPRRATALTLVDGRAQTVRRLRWLAGWASVCDVAGDLREAGADVGADEVAALAVSLRDIGLRDGVIAWLCPGTLPLDSLDPDLLDQLRTSLPRPAWASSPPTPASVIAGRRMQARLVQLCRMLPAREAAPMLTVLANFAWCLGDGALARAALERALAAEPGYRLAGLLERMVELAIRPRASA